MSGNKECKEDCSKFSKYYYDSDNNECLDSCELRHTKQFSYPVNKNDPICKSACNDGHF